MNWIWVLAAAMLSFAVAAISGKWLVPFLTKVKCGQTIREEGPKWHKGKQGTPTMGGFMFILGIFVSLAVCFGLYGFFGDYSDIFSNRLMNAKILGGLLLAAMSGLTGFADDYIKVVKKRNLGLTAKQKLILQFLSAAVYLLILYLNGATTETFIPFIGNVDLGFFYWIIAAIVIVGICNAVNLTDGIDGLNGSITFFVAVFMSAICAALYMTGMSMVCIAVSGGCLGFLVWNFYPAKVFMGDTGSLFLGGIVCAMTFAVDMPILLLLVGFVYLAEMFSVILQVLYFKATHGKRLFKMSPIHHHFEMCGWSEIKIVSVFSIVTILTSAIALLCVIFGRVYSYNLL